jgi:hypothetical protein
MVGSSGCRSSVQALFFHPRPVPLNAFVFLPQLRRFLIIASLTAVIWPVSPLNQVRAFRFSADQLFLIVHLFSRFFFLRRFKLFLMAVSIIAGILGV